jgi:hypothetical protein
MGAATTVLLLQPGRQLGEAVVHFASGMPAGDTVGNTFSVSKRVFRAAGDVRRWDTGMVRHLRSGRIVLGDVVVVQDRRPDGSVMSTSDGAVRAGSA